MRALCAAAVLLLIVSAGIAAQQSAAPPAEARDPRVAQLTAPTGKSADWQQWDGFLTTVVKKLADDLPASRRDQLASSSSIPGTSYPRRWRSGPPIPFRASFWTRGAVSRRC